MKAIIEPTTTAATRSLYVAADEYVSVAVAGLTGTEKITFKIDLGGSLVDIRPEVALTVKLNYFQIAGPNTYEIIKPATVSAAGVYVVT